MTKLNQKMVCLLQPFCEYFSADYYRQDLGEEPLFASVITAGFRILLNWPLFLIAGAWICAVIYGIAKQMSLLALLPVSLLLAVLLLAAVFVAFLLLMLLEAVAKIPASLILYGRLPKGAENPVDGLVACLVQGRL